MAAQEHQPQLVVGDDVDEVVEVVELGVGGRVPCRRCGVGGRRGGGRSRVDSRRSRSMARLRAVVVIQPPGFGGTPVGRPLLGGDGERLRDRVLGEVDVAEDADQGGGAAAGLTPEDRRASVVSHPASGGPRPGPRRRRRLAGPLEGGVEVGGLDDPEAAHLLLGLGVGAVGHRHVAAGGAHDGGRRRRLQAGAEHPGAGALQLLVERADLGDRGAGSRGRTKSSRRSRRRARRRSGTGAWSESPSSSVVVGGSAAGVAGEGRDDDRRRRAGGWRRARSWWRRRAGSATDGTHDRAVSATATWRNRRRAGLLQPVQHGEEQPAEDGAEEGHLGEAERAGSSRRRSRAARRRRGRRRRRPWWRRRRRAPDDDGGAPQGAGAGW